MKRGLLIIPAILLLTPTTELQALDLSQVRINGFVTQGYMKSSDNNFLTDSLDGSTQINEVALTVTARPNDRLRIGFQLLSRDLGQEGNNEVRLDWGFGDYRLRDWLGVRLGKVKLPIGLYNEGRDSDFLRPMAFLPQSVYDENKRNLLVAAQGGALYGNVPVANLGDFDYQVFYGQINFPVDSPTFKGFQGQASQVARNEELGAISRFQMENKYLYGGSLIYNTPVNGLRLGASFLQAKSDVTIALASGNPTPGVNETRMRDMTIYSLEYSLPRFMLAAEYIDYRLQRRFFGKLVSPWESQGWYVLASYRVVDEVALSLLYDVFYENKDDKDGNFLVARGQRDFLGWRKDFGVGVRWDIDDHWLVKAEYHYVDGAALGLQVFNPPGALERYWDYYILKASFNF